MSIDTITTLAVTAADHGGHWEGDGPPGFVPILWFVLLAAIIGGAIYFARRRNAVAPGRAGETRLAEMFATGEISEDEYRARRAVLREKK